MEDWKGFATAAADASLPGMSPEGAATCGCDFVASAISNVEGCREPFEHEE